MNNIDSFDYFPAQGKEYDMILWVIASEMNDFRVIAKKERFSLTQKDNTDIEFNIKLLDQLFHTRLYSKTDTVKPRLD